MKTCVLKGTFSHWTLITQLSDAGAGSPECKHRAYSALIWLMFTTASRDELRNPLCEFLLLKLDRTFSFENLHSCVFYSSSVRPHL